MLTTIRTIATVFCVVALSSTLFSNQPFELVVSRTSNDALGLGLWQAFFLIFLTSEVYVARIPRMHNSNFLMYIFIHKSLCIGDVKGLDTHNRALWKLRSHDGFHQHGSKAENNTFALPSLCKSIVGTVGANGIALHRNTRS